MNVLLAVLWKDLVSEWRTGDRLLSMERIGELFRFFLANPDHLPQAYAQQALDEPPHRVVCDYIAGMTDVFFQRTYEQMLGPAFSPRLS